MTIIIVYFIFHSWDILIFLCFDFLIFILCIMKHANYIPHTFVTRQIEYHCFNGILWFLQRPDMRYVHTLGTYHILVLIFSKIYFISDVWDRGSLKICVHFLILFLDLWGIHSISWNDMCLFSHVLLTIITDVNYMPHNILLVLKRYTQCQLYLYIYIWYTPWLLLWGIHSIVWVCI